MPTMRMGQRGLARAWNQEHSQDVRTVPAALVGKRNQGGGRPPCVVRRSRLPTRAAR